MKWIWVIFGFLGLLPTAFSQTTRVRLKQLELAPDTLHRYVVAADTVTGTAYWEDLDSLGITGGGAATTLYLRGDAGTLSTLTDGDTIDIKTGAGLSSWGKSPDQILLTLDSTGVVEGTYNFATVTVNAQGRITLITGGVEIDGSITNEGLMGVAAGGANDATLYTNTSGNLGTTFAGGTGITVTETTAANGGTITIANAGDLSATNEIQQIDTLSLSGTVLSASLSSDGVAAKTVNLSGLLTGYPTGSGTSGYVARWTGTSTLGTGILKDNGTNSVSLVGGGFIRHDGYNQGLRFVAGDIWYYNSASNAVGGWLLSGGASNGALAIGGSTPTYKLDILNGGGVRLPSNTTAARPTGAAGVTHYNSTLGIFEGYSSAWNNLGFPVGTSGQTIRHDGTSWVANSGLYNDGNTVGIGTTTPNIGFVGSKLTTYGTSATDGYGIISAYRGSSAAAAGTGYQYILNNSIGAATTYGYANAIIVTNTAGAHTGAMTWYVPNAGAIAERMRLTGSGSLGLNITPSYTLDISSTGGIRIPVGTTAQRPTGAAGVLRYNSTLSQFEGHNGTTWLPQFLPVGTSGQTIRHDGTSWVANSGLYNSGTKVGIGTVSPATELHILTTGISTRGLMVSQHTANIFGPSIFFRKSRGDEATPATVADKDFVGAFNFQSHDGTSYSADNAYFGAYVTGAVSTGVTPVSIYFTAGSGASYSPDLLIHSGGNIGIGSSGNGDLIGAGLTTPPYALTVYGTDAIKIPIGTTAQRPTGAQGILRVNSDSTKIEWYNGSAWKSLTSGVGSVGTMSSWTLAGTSGTPQTVADGQTGTIAAGYGMITTAAATRTVTVTADTLNNPTLATGNLSIAQNRTVTSAAGKRLRFAGSHTYDGGSWRHDMGYNTNYDIIGYYWRYASNRGEVVQSFGQDYYPAISDSVMYWNANVYKTSGGKSTSLTLNEDATASLSGISSTASKNAVIGISATSAAGYGPYLYGTDGMEIDMGASGNLIIQVNNVSKIQMDNSGNLGIGDTSPEGKLDVNGVTKTNQIVGQGNNPSVATNANMGTGRAVALTTAQSSDLAGRGYFTSGTGLTAGEWFTMTWGTAYSQPPIVIIQCENANCASLQGLIYVQPSTTGASIAVNSASASYESKTYEFSYIVVGGK